MDYPKQSNNGQQMAINQTHLYKMLTLIVKGDKSAFDQFYDATINLTFATVIRITANKQLAEEVVSDVYMQVWQTATSYDSSRATPLTWLSMIARSRSIDVLRREKALTRKQLPLNDDYDVADEDKLGPLKKALEGEEVIKIRDLLRVLKRPERQMIILAFYRDMSHREIAAFTGEPLGSVKTTLRRAQRLLRSAV